MGAVKHTPYIDAILRFDVEDDMRKMPERPCAQARQAQFYGIARGAAARMPANVPIGPLQSVDEVERCPVTRLTKVVFDRLIDVAAGQLTRHDRLRLHRREPAARLVRSRLRSLLK